MGKVFLVERMEETKQGHTDSDVRFIGTTEELARQFCENYPKLMGRKHGILRISRVTVDSDDFYACVGDHIADYNMDGEEFVGHDPTMTIKYVTDGEFTRSLPYEERLRAINAAWEQKQAKEN
jgi:hypothetical protein